MKRPDIPLVSAWRLAESCVTLFKEAYRHGSKQQRGQMRAWMRRVLAGKDGDR